MNILTTVVVLLVAIYYITGFFNNLKFFNQNFIKK